MDQILFAVMLLAVIWLIFELLYEFGPVVLLLLLTGVGAVIVAIMTLIGIRVTWKPIALILLTGLTITLVH